MLCSNLAAVVTLFSEHPDNFDIAKEFYSASLLSVNTANMVNILEKLVTGTMT